MRINKLKLKHLTPYLPYQLMILNTQENKLINLLSISSDGFLNKESYDSGVKPFNINQIKPVLRPISSMSIEEIEELQDTVKDEDIYISVSKTNIWIEDNTSDPYGGHMELHIDVLYEAYEWLFKNHFDIFNLIRRGLAIEKI